MKPFNENYVVSEPGIIKLKVLNFLKGFGTFCMLENAMPELSSSGWKFMIGIGTHKSFHPPGHDFKEFDQFLKTIKHPCFGHLGYGLKNRFFNLEEDLPPYIDFGPFSFFEPEILLTIYDGKLEISSYKDNCHEIFTRLENADAILAANAQAQINITGPGFNDYTDKFDKIQKHIQRGNFYEINYCSSFKGTGVIDPFSVYYDLINVSPMPFSAFYRNGDAFCMCASPERYLKKMGDNLISQPMKGTAKRDNTHAGTDQKLKASLSQNKKERAENIIVVDLVRNDLSRVAARGAVAVPELCSVYSFPAVHQMISTVACEISDAVTFTDIVAATFPMGSMTGAPKKIVLQTIAELEEECRGLFSGSIGYILPGSDFDFNVVIRSIFYNATSNRIAFNAGGAITSLANAAEEFEETMLKASVMLKILTN